MPVLKHAKKKLRQDKKRTLDNLRIKDTYKKLLKAARTKKSTDAVAKAFQAIDKAAKNNVIHDNKAARLKSTLSKVVSGQAKSTAAVKKSAKAAQAAKADKKARKVAKARASSAEMGKSRKSAKKSAKKSK